MFHLRRLQIQGFRSLRDVALDFPGAVTVLIGPNGAGKSNLLGALRLLGEVYRDSVGLFVGQSGGASSLLRDGPKVTPEMSLGLEFEEETRGEPPEALSYLAKLAFSAGDRLMFREEHAAYGRHQRWTSPGGQFETALPDLVPFPDGKRRTTRWEFIVRLALGTMSYYHFHDTSFNAAIRNNARVADSVFLRPDGSNLAAYLWKLKQSTDQTSWKRMLGLVRVIAPFIKDLLPFPSLDSDNVSLAWRDDRDAIFGPHQLSDGTLRAIALFTALAQPRDKIPGILTIDEPELGLHPAALSLFFDVVRVASQHAQIILSTQSPQLLNYVTPDEVIVAERQGGESTFRRLDAAALKGWLEDYTLAELYDKNVLGGRP